MTGIGKSLVILGVIIAAVGLLVQLGERIPWIGRLPGDIHIRKEHFSFYFPLGTCLLLSVIFSLIMWLFRR